MVVSHSFKHEEVLGLKFGQKPIGRPNMFVHIYFVDGLLIDTGQSKTRRKILSETSKLDIDQIFVTHHHEDHSGNIRELKNQHQCDVFASSSCCEIMKAPPPLSLVQKITWGDRPSQQNLIPKVDAIATNKFNFQIIPIPGHASDMVALYEPNRQWLFSADLYLSTRIDYMLKNESIADQIASTQKILNLDFKEMFCSHKPQMTDGREQLTKKLNFLQSFSHDVSTLYEKGNSTDEIFKSLKLKENRLVKTLSNGALSKLNMVNSVIRDVERRKSSNF